LVYPGMARGRRRYQVKRMKDISSLYASVNNEIRKSTRNFESLLGINLGVRCIFIKKDGSPIIVPM